MYLLCYDISKDGDGAYVFDSIYPEQTNAAFIIEIDKFQELEIDYDASNKDTYVQSNPLFSVLSGMIITYNKEFIEEPKIIEYIDNKIKSNDFKFKEK